MPQKANKSPENVPGSYYVDDTCTDCDLCRNLAPAFFRRIDDKGYTVVYHQPGASIEIAAAEEARQSCPSDSIGNDGAL